jgi:phosphatidylinositol alpha-1,6-mannosyltransferase
VSARAHREILVLTPDFPPEVGGIQTVALRVTTGLTRFKPRVVTLASSGSEEFDQARPFEIVRVSSVAGRRFGIGALNLRGLAEGLRLRPRAVLSLHIVTGPAAIAAARAVRCPVVQYVHAQELAHRRRLARYVLRRSDAIVAVSSYSRSLVGEVGGPLDRTRVVHPGVDAPVEPPAPSMAGDSIAVVSRLEERYKGHDILLRSLPLVLERVPQASLDVIGDGPLRPGLERLARELDVGGAVRFHGAVGDTRRDAILAGATVFAMPSRTDPDGAGEGFGIVYAEAGARGLPVVAGNVGGAVDAVVDGETGLLVDPGDREAVAEALTAILLDRARARRMGEAGWRHARSLSWERTAAQVESLIAEVAR